MACTGLLSCRSGPFARSCHGMCHACHASCTLSLHPDPIAKAASQTASALPPRSSSSGCAVSSVSDFGKTTVGKNDSCFPLQSSTGFEKRPEQSRRQYQGEEGLPTRPLINNPGFFMTLVRGDSLPTKLPVVLLIPIPLILPPEITNPVRRYRPNPLFPGIWLGQGRCRRGFVGSLVVSGKGMENGLVGIVGW